MWHPVARRTLVSETLSVPFPVLQVLATQILAHQIHQPI